jgi:hypothetical protein
MDEDEGGEAEPKRKKRKEDCTWIPDLRKCDFGRLKRTSCRTSAAERNGRRGTWLMTPSCARDLSWHRRRVSAVITHVAVYT